MSSPPQRGGSLIFPSPSGSTLPISDAEQEIQKILYPSKLDAEVIEVQNLIRPASHGEPPKLDVTNVEGKSQSERDGDSDNHKSHHQSLTPVLIRKRSELELPALIYSNESRRLLLRLWGPRLGEDTIVQVVLDKIHSEIPPRDHKLLCFAMWAIQANRIIHCQSVWKFYQFAFHPEMETESSQIFQKIANSWNFADNMDQKTPDRISEDWGHIMNAIGGRIDFELREKGYPLCSCMISQPHSIRQLQESVEQLKRASNEERAINNEKPSDKKARNEMKARLVLAAFKTLRALDMIEKANSKNVHDIGEIREFAHNVLREISNTKGLPPSVQEELNDTIDHASRDSPDLIRINSLSIGKSFE